MSISYQWKIADLERESVDGYITKVFYEVTAVDCQFNSVIDGCVSLNQSETRDNFVPFESLTEDLIVQWIKEQMGQEWVRDHELNLEKQIEVQRNPTSRFGLPWLNV